MAVGGLPPGRRIDAERLPARSADRGHAGQRRPAADRSRAARRAVGRVLADRRDARDVPPRGVAGRPAIVQVSRRLARAGLADRAARSRSRRAHPAVRRGRPERARREPARAGDPAARPPARQDPLRGRDPQHGDERRRHTAAGLAGVRRAARRRTVRPSAVRRAGRPRRRDVRRAPRGRRREVRAGARLGLPHRVGRDAARRPDRDARRRAAGDRRSRRQPRRGAVHHGGSAQHRPELPAVPGQLQVARLLDPRRGHRLGAVARRRRRSADPRPATPRSPRSSPGASPIRR